jgi:hypothetical protein
MLVKGLLTKIKHGNYSEKKKLPLKELSFVKYYKPFSNFRLDIQQSRQLSGRLSGA